MIFSFTKNNFINLIDSKKMKIKSVGFIPNKDKKDIEIISHQIFELFQKKNIKFFIESSFGEKFDKISERFKCNFLHINDFNGNVDLIATIGGDGTLLSAAKLAIDYDIPIVGINYGKLGFLSEIDYTEAEYFANDLLNDRLYIQERMILEGYVRDQKNGILYAVNDIVIDKNGWPKVIEISIYADNEFVCKFIADGIIVSTPVGSTGYSLSVGGPVISPNSEVICLAPISPHSLTIRPIVLSSDYKIEIEAFSPHYFVQISCDGQRIINYNSPLKIQIKKSHKKLKLALLKTSNYFRILREKLYWGLDFRKENKI